MPLVVHTNFRARRLIDNGVKECRLRAFCYPPCSARLASSRMKSKLVLFSFDTIPSILPILHLRTAEKRQNREPCVDAGDLDCGEPGKQPGTSCYLSSLYLQLGWFSELQKREIMMTSFPEDNISSLPR